MFCDRHGEAGNPLGVFLDGAAIPVAERQGVARELGFSETVFLEDRREGTLRIFTPETELAFAGHPHVGTAWLLAQLGTPLRVLLPPAGAVEARLEGDLTWIAGEPEWCPPMELDERAAPEDVDAAAPADAGEGVLYVWSWLDRAAGLIRARSFAPALGIDEDEATGAAALTLCARLGRPIEVRQGAGSVLHARPLRDGRVEVGGRCALDEVVEFERGSLQGTN